MTKQEYIDLLLANFDTFAEEVPCQSGPGTVKKVSYTKAAFKILLTIVLNDEHIIWNGTCTRKGNI